MRLTHVYNSEQRKLADRPLRCLFPDVQPKRPLPRRWIQLYSFLGEPKQICQRRTSVKSPWEPVLLSLRPDRDTTVHDAPAGYPRLARFVSLAEGCYVFREFRYLQSRSLLHLQDEVRALEAQLYRMDEVDRVKAPDLLKSRELDDYILGVRSQLMAEIRGKLKEYGTSTGPLNILTP